MQRSSRLKKQSQADAALDAIREAKSGRRAALEDLDADGLEDDDVDMPDAAAGNVDSEASQDAAEADEDEQAKHTRPGAARLVQAGPPHVHIHIDPEGPRRAACNTVCWPRVALC